VQSELGPELGPVERLGDAAGGMENPVVGPGEEGALLELGLLEGDYLVCAASRKVTRSDRNSGMSKEKAMQLWRKS
jgi:hypothetical protein